MITNYVLIMDYLLKLLIVNYINYELLTQVLPYFVINKLGHLKGFPGLFTACVYGAALRYNLDFKVLVGEEGNWLWRGGESAGLSPIWPGSDSGSLSHVGCVSEVLFLLQGVYLRALRFSFPLRKNQTCRISKFKLDQDR